MKKIGFLSFGHWTPSPHSQTRSAADSLLQETGDETKVSLRAVAERCSCTPASIYLHFADKEQLILEVCQRHFVALSAAVRAASDAESDPLRRLRTGLAAYVRFGLDHPEAYRIMFMSRPGPAADRLTPQAIMDASGFAYLADAVRAAMDAGAMAASDVQAVASGLWAAVHGITSLLIAKPYFPFPAAIVDHCIDTHLRGLAAPPQGAGGA